MALDHTRLASICSRSSVSSATSLLMRGDSGISESSSSVIQSEDAFYHDWTNCDRAFRCIASCHSNRNPTRSKQPAEPCMFGCVLSKQLSHDFVLVQRMSEKLSSASFRCAIHIGRTAVRLFGLFETRLATDDGDGEAGGRNRQNPDQFTHIEVIMSRRAVVPSRRPRGILTHSRNECARSCCFISSSPKRVAVF